jgi:hypothetical protein
MSECTYKEFIKEAYIDPIRSVSIVDDDYPTLEEVLAETSEGTPSGALYQKQWHADRRPFRDVVNNFRQQQWMIDTHDGRDNYECGIAKHLHQSDLLVLDYQLDGHSGGGEKCLSVIQKLASNNHHNLVIVYTQNPQPQLVFSNIVMSLLSPCPHVAKKQDVLDSLNSRISQWEEADESIADKLSESIDIGLYLGFRRNTSACLREMAKGEGGRFHQFISVYLGKPETVDVNKTLLLWWVIRKKETEWRSMFSISGLSKCEWSDESALTPWVRTDKLFVTVISKANERDLPKALLDALENWSPSPSRLILAKIRNQVDDSGFTAEESFTEENVAIQAGWYKGLLDASSEKVATETETAIARYWDGLNCALSGSVKEFVRRLLEYEHRVSRPSDDVVFDRFKYKISELPNLQNALVCQNAYNCSKSPGGWHLTTGHILKTENGEYWACVSPACDLVPGQKKEKGRYDKLNPALPFHAVRLYEYPKEQAMREVSYGRCVFLKVEGEIRAFSLVDINVPNGLRAEANPAWEECFVEDQGKFAMGTDIRIKIHRSAWCAETHNISTKQEEVQIVGQLRYEYALNLMQRHASTLSRIGLGFVGLPRKEA